MTPVQQIITVALCVGATMTTRFLPFLIFPPGRTVPRSVNRLGKMLPAAAFGLLVVYSFKDLTPLLWPHGLPELIAAAAVAGLHIWRRNMLLSIAGGTILYMLLLRFCF